ncbi:Gp138 family membrane-puncturing spike protein [Mycobacteroides abscessus]|uniref:Gp138 family membrane-puncturing spike protein n=1 Tax=Mycobacteroides abscessus TaxID=36809 RepID=UPI0012FFD417
MSEATRFFNNLSYQVAMTINTAMPCKVISYNESKRTAKIQPLFMTKEVGREPEALPPIDGVPVLFQRYKINNLKPISISTDAGEHAQYTGSGGHEHKSLTFKQSVEMIPDLRSGDVVLVVFSQRALDNVSSGKVAYPGINRHHDLQDAVIVGVI